LLYHKISCSKNKRAELTESTSKELFKLLKITDLIGLILFSPANFSVRASITQEKRHLSNPERIQNNYVQKPLIPEIRPRPKKINKHIVPAKNISNGSNCHLMI